MTTRTTRRLAAAAMAAAALLAIAGFTALGSVFEYPQILKSPTADILDLYRRHQGAVTTWFLALMVSAALLAPAGILLGRLAGGSRGRWIAGLGVAAAAVQVIGLSRWVVLVPGISRDALDPARTADAHHSFELVHTWLGTVLGETIGYALTAAFTVLITLAVIGLTAGVLIAAAGGKGIAVACDVTKLADDDLGQAYHRAEYFRHLRALKKLAPAGPRDELSRFDPRLI